MLKMTASFLFYLLGLCITSTSSVSIDDYGDIGYECFAEINTEISKLSSDDLDRVDSLKFVQVMHRHGVRFGQTLLEDIFPDEEAFSFECNVQTMYSQAIRSDTDDNDLDQASHQFNWVFTENEQFYENSNCEFTQIADLTPKQMIRMGNALSDRYFATNNGNSHDNDEFDQQYLSSDYVDFYVLDVNRCRQSAVWLVQGLLEDSTESNNDNIIEFEIHDEDSDPFRAEHIEVCVGNDEYTSWKSRYVSGTDRSGLQSDYINSAEVQSVQTAFELEGGVFSTRHLGALARWYCTGIDIPLSGGTLQDMADVGVEYSSIYDESETGEFLNRCYRHEIMRSAYYKTLEHLNAALESDDNSKMFVINTQGNRMINYMWGLDLFDGRGPKQSEMLTLEVYAGDPDNDENIDYYFRWLRDGSFIPFKACQEYYDSENTQLCDLNTLLNHEYGFGDALSFADWKDTCVNAESLCLCGLCDA